MAGLDATGTALSRSDMESSPTFTDVANISSGPDGPDISVTEEDVSAHDSPDKHKEFIPGMVDAGAVSFDINWNPVEVTHQPLITDAQTPNVRDYMITYPDGSTVDFSAFVTGFSPSAPVDDKLAASVSFKVTGKPTFTAAS